MKNILIGLFALLLSTPALAQSKGWPEGATPIHVMSSNFANAELTATIPAVADTWNYITGVVCMSNGATAASYITATITGLQGGTVTLILYVPVNTAGGNNNPLQGSDVVPIAYPWAASAKNTAITLTVPALGAGNTLTRCILEGFRTPTSVI